MRLPEIKPYKKYRFDEIFDAVALSARRYGVKVLASQLDADERYLQSKLTTSQSSSAHYLRADEMIGIRLATGDLTSLRMEAELHDHLLVPREGYEPGESREAHSLDMLSLVGRFQVWLSNSLRDGEITDVEWQAGQTIFALMERYAAAARRMGEGK